MNAHAQWTSGPGPLLLIGGSEDRVHSKVILRLLFRVIGDAGRLVVITSASQIPKRVGAMYSGAFAQLEVEERVDILHLSRRSEAAKPANVARIEHASAVFFTGGDQTRLASLLGGTPVLNAVQALHNRGGVVSGTSAGAMAIPRTILYPRRGDPHRTLGTETSPGLGLIDNLLVDSHFTQRDRLARLCGAVAQNPQNLGVGIDEDTALLVTCNELVEVAGSGAAYFVDGSKISYTSLADGTTTQQRVPLVFNLAIHVLLPGDRFNLSTRRPEHAG